MPEALNVVVLCGGKSAEHEISLLSAGYVTRTLVAAGFPVAVVGISRDGGMLPAAELRSTLEAEAPLPPSVSVVGQEDWRAVLLGLEPRRTVVFPVMHGPFGEDGIIQGFLEALDLPYVGAGVAGSAVGMNKIFCKAILQQAGLPVLPGVSCHVFRWRREKGAFLGEVADRLAWPVFVKPANLGSSIGVARCETPGELEVAVDEAFAYGDWVLVEQGIAAREIEVSVLGGFAPRASLPGEIVPADCFYTYEAKYVRDDSRLLIPAPLDADQVRAVQDLAVRAYVALQLEGMARMDFLLDRVTGRWYVNEPNTIPGFTRISMYPKLWEASGLAPEELMRELVRLAMERWNRRRAYRVVRS
ncbi:MAG: D-alanine--D-alanine ligase family protein [Acidobacteriota bacterium]